MNKNQPGTSEMVGAVLPVATLRHEGFVLSGLNLFTRGVVEKVNGHQPVLHESLVDARKVLKEGYSVLLQCAVIQDKNSFGDMSRKRELTVYPTNGDIRGISVQEYSQILVEGTLDMKMGKKAASFQTREGFHLEHAGKMFPDCSIRYFPDDFGNWVHILLCPNKN